jgi:hypothetical protein
MDNSALLVTGENDKDILNKKLTSENKQLKDKIAQLEEVTHKLE